MNCFYEPGSGCFYDVLTREDEMVAWVVWDFFPSGLFSQISADLNRRFSQIIKIYICVHQRNLREILDRISGK